MDDMELSEEQEKKLLEHSSDSESSVKMSGMYMHVLSIRSVVMKIYDSS